MRLNDASLQAAKDRAASQPRADIGSILPTLGSVAGNIIAPGIGGAIGGGLGSVLGSAIDGGSSNGTTSAVNNGLTAAEISALGQQAASGDANEVANLVKTAQGSVGTNTQSALDEFLQLANAYGPSPALGYKAAQLGATPTVQGIGSDAKVAPAGGAAAAPGSLSGAITQPTTPTNPGGNIAAALTQAGVPTTSTSSGGSLTPAQQAVVSAAVAAGNAVAANHGTGDDINAAIKQYVAANGPGAGMTAAQIAAVANDGIQGQGKWGNGAPGAAWDAQVSNAILGAPAAPAAAAPAASAAAPATPVVAPGAGIAAPAAAATAAPAAARGTLASAVAPRATLALRGVAA